MHMRKVGVVLAVCGLSLSLAHAQTTSPTQPKCWFWEPPNTARPIRAEFAPLVRTLVCVEDTSAYQAARELETIDFDVAGGMGGGCGGGLNGFSTVRIMRKWADPDNNPNTTWNWVGPGYSVFLQNAKLTQHRKSSYSGKEGWNDQRDWEKVDVDVASPTGSDLPFVAMGDPPTDGYIQSENDRRAQPWMYAGRDLAVDQFWGSFPWLVATGLTASGIPYGIERAHIDVEPYNYSWNGQVPDLGMTNFYTPRPAYLLYALPLENTGAKPVNTNGVWSIINVSGPGTFLTSENRWHNLPVPGFGSQTLNDLWNQVKGNFGNRAYPLMAGVNYLSFPAQTFNGGPNNDNRGVYMWWSSINERALAASHEEVIMQSLKAAFPSLRGGNYDMSYVRPGTADFGWYQTSPATATPWQSPIASKRLGKRGIHDSHSHGAAQSRVDLSAVTGQGGSLGYEWFTRQETDRIGEYSSPYLYAVGSIDNNSQPNTFGDWRTFRQNDVYRPTYPIESRWGASSRSHRWHLESIIASEGARSGGSPWLTVAPWVVAPGSVGSVFDTAPYTPTPDDVVRQQALLRSKRISEVLVFNQRLPNTNNADYYAAFEQAYKRVYEPQIVEIVNDAAGTLAVVDEINAPVQEFASGFAAAAQDAVEDTNERWQSIGGTPTAYQGKQKRLRAQAGRNSSDPTAVVTKINFAAQVTPAGTNQFPACEMLRFTLECDVTMNNPCEILSSNGQPCGAPMHLEGRVRLLNPAGGYGADLELAQQDCDGAGGQPAFFEVNGGVNYYGFWAPRTSTTDVTQILSTPNPCKAVDDTVNRVTGSFNVQMRRTFDVDVPSNVMSSLIDSAGRIRFDLLVRARSFGQNFTSDASMTVDWNLIQVTRIGRPNTYCANGDNPNDTPIGGGEGAAMAGSTMMVDGGDTPADVNLDDAVDLLDLQVLLDAQTRAQPSGDYNSDGLQDDIDVVELIEDIADAV